jgi:hypothetical protein
VLKKSIGEPIDMGGESTFFDKEVHPPKSQSLEIQHPRKSKK